MLSNDKICQADNSHRLTKREKRGKEEDSEEEHKKVEEKGRGKYEIGKEEEY